MKKVTVLNTTITPTKVDEFGRVSYIKEQDIVVEYTGLDCVKEILKDKFMDLKENFTDKLIDLLEN